jgi:hypothetical protein
MREYQNEVIVSIAMVLMIVAYLYKQSVVTKIDTTKSEITSSIADIGDIIALKEQWGDPKISKKIKSIKSDILGENIRKFEIKNRKLIASFSRLSSKEINRVITKIENIAVQIINLQIESRDGKYSMEVKCKW